MTSAPTPAVLPDALEQAVLAGNAVERLFATAPASDAAVPAGEPFGYWIEHKYAEPVFLRGPAYDPEPSDLRVITPLYAAAPKVASDTGAST